MNFAPTNIFAAASFPETWITIRTTMTGIGEGRVMTPTVSNDARIAQMVPEPRLIRVKGMRMVQAPPENRIVIGNKYDE